MHDCQILATKEKPINPNVMGVTMKDFLFLLIVLMTGIYFFVAVTKIDTKIKRNLPDALQDIYGGYT